MIYIICDIYHIYYIYQVLFVALSILETHASTQKIRADILYEQKGICK